MKTKVKKTVEQTKDGRGRPTTLEKGWKQVCIQLEPSTLKQADQRRGSEPRSSYLRRMISLGMEADRDK
jgi:hypothetical protein